MSESGTPFQGLAFNLSSLGYAVSRGFTDTLAPFELHPRESAVLRVAGFEEGQSQQALGDALRIPRSRMVAIVDELEGRKLLERRHDPSDRRVRALYLTNPGRLLLEQAFAEAVAYEQQVSSALSSHEREQLLALLDRVSASLGVGDGAHAALREPVTDDHTDV
jgi:DNA-binding MarR family transcriptional regulator